jgi:hypothetical protein
MAGALTWLLRDRIVSAGVPRAPPREPVYMTPVQPEDSNTCDKSDDQDLSFDFDVQIDSEKYSRIMRHTFGGDGTATPIYAFNSSI